MTDDESAHLELVPGSSNDDLAVFRSGGILVLDGPQEVVDRLVAGDPALRVARRVEPSSAIGLGAIAALKPLLTSMGDSTQTVFQLDEAGQALYESGTLSAVGDGFYRLFGRATDGTISGHGALKPVAMAPQTAVAAQLAVVTLALTAAIKEVQEAVERVEDKVDILRDLLEADRDGEIIGTNRSLRRRAQQVGFDGTMSDADWHAIADAGVEVEQQIERLRSFIRKRLAAAEDAGQKISGRLEAVEHARAVAETLALLVVAQDSLFLYQQLRILRIRATQPEYIQAAIDEARELIDQHLDEDADLTGRVRTLVADRVTVEALEMVRFITANSMVRLAPQVDDSLSWFASQRGLPYDAITVPPLPTASEVVEEARDRGLAIASESRRAIGDLADRVRNRDDEESVAELGGTQHVEALPPGTAPPNDAGPTKDPGPISKAWSATVSRVRRSGQDGSASEATSAHPDEEA